MYITRGHSHVFLISLIPRLILLYRRKASLTNNSLHLALTSHELVELLSLPHTPTDPDNTDHGHWFSHLLRYTCLVLRHILYTTQRLGYLSTNLISEQIIYNIKSPWAMDFWYYLYIFTVRYHQGVWYNSWYHTSDPGIDSKHLG